MDKFDQLYKKYEDLVSDGTFDGDARDKVDTILQMIYDTDDLPSGIYESLKTDEEKEIFLKDFANACDEMMKNPACDTDDDKDGKEDLGVIAQEVEKELPFLVSTNGNGNLAVKYQSLIPLLIEAVKELSNRVEELENN